MTNFIQIKMCLYIGKLVYLRTTYSGILMSTIKFACFHIIINILFSAKELLENHKSL